MSTGEKISVVIPLYNSSALISRALNSINFQETSCPVEVTVVDDGSTDNSVEIVKNSSSPVTIINQSNQGPAAARNKGILASSGKYLAFLDADDYWNPGFLSATSDFLEKNPEAVAVSTGQIHKIPGKADTVVPSFLKDNHRIPPEPVLIDDFYGFWAKYNHVCTGSVMMRTEFAKKSGGQRTDLRITEDLEYWAYLASSGQWGFIPQVLFVSDGGLITRETGWIEKNRKRWESAPSIEEWEERIINNFSGKIPQSYYSFRGRIIRNLVYSMIMSDRKDLARQTVRQNIEQLPSDKLSQLYRLASFSRISWNILADYLYKREYNRKF